MKNVLTILVFGLVSLSGLAQDALVSQVAASTATVDKKTKAKQDTLAWDIGGAYNLNFSQVGLKNWSGGGQGSMALGTLLSLRANYHQGEMLWNNTLDMAYGVTRVGNKNDLFKKTDDQIILLSKYSRAVNEKWAFSGFLDFRTQIAAGLTYREDIINGVPTEVKDQVISKFFSPSYTILSAGFEYKKDKHFYALISPLAGKITTVMDQTLSDAGAFGVTPGENVRTEFGAIFKLGWQYEAMENVDFKTNFMAFQGYGNIGHIDVNWETVTVFKINKYLSSTFTTLLIYDEDIDITREDGTVGPATQFKNVLTIGLLYKF